MKFLALVCVGSSRRNGVGQEVNESTQAFPSYTRAQLIYNAESLCGLSDTLPQLINMVACQLSHVHFVEAGDQSGMEVINEASLLIELSGMLKISQSQIMEKHCTNENLLSYFSKASFGSPIENHLCSVALTRISPSAHNLKRVLLTSK